MEIRNKLDNMFAGLSTQQMLDLGMSAEDMSIAKSLSEMRKKVSGKNQDSMSNKPQGLSRNSNGYPAQRTFEGTSNRKNAEIESLIERDKPVTVDHPTSYRFYSRAQDGYIDRLSMDEYRGARRTGISSTCVKKIRYDPKKSKCWITFVGGTKEYVFKVPPEAFEEFIDATSKGRHTNFVLKQYFRAPKSWY